MLFYHGTSKTEANIIKINGFTWKLLNTIYFNNNYLDAKCCAGDDGEVLKVDIKYVNALKLNTDYNSNDVNHTREMKIIIMYSKLNSTKNCVVNIYNNKFLFFRQFDYKIYL